MATRESPFHRGEKAVQAQCGGGERAEQLGRRMILPELSLSQQLFLSEQSTLMIAVTDADGRPWASLLNGPAGFLRSIDASRLRVDARPASDDPLSADFTEGTAIGALALSFPTRQRARLNGRVENLGEAGFDIKVSQAYGNCDMYIQTREPKIAAAPSCEAEHSVRRAETLNRAEAGLIARSDTFFIATQATGTGEGTDGMDLSHRGGPPGFVMVAHESLLLFPDYPGNGMFNTLGNLKVDPRAGLLFMNFETGDRLQVTGEAQVLWEPHHVSRFPGAERVVAFSVKAVVYVERALPLAWSFGDYSPAFDRFPQPELDPPPSDLGTMCVVSLNLSMPRDIVHEDTSVTTGIFKQSVERRVRLERLNLDGDGQADLYSHGGAFRALYVYSREHYDYWSDALNRDDLEPGQFGENLTIEGMLEDDVQVGDVFRIGSALVEVSQPRIPCFKLAIKMGIEDFQTQFLKSGRVGFYLRVVETGEIAAGDRFELIGRDPSGMSVRAMSDLLFFRQDDLEATRQALAIRGLSHGWKGSFEERLAQAEKRGGARQDFREFVVKKKQPESETITSFYLEPVDREPLSAFRAGQFLTFELDIADCDEPVIRTYSISDSPDCSYYRVSIKREPPPRDQPDAPPGLSSNYFHDHVEVGTVLRVGAPRGAFTLRENKERSLVLLSGGVGITPLLSMLNTVVRQGSGQRTWFIHGARNGREHAFGEHVRRVAAENDNVTAHIVYSSPGDEDVQGLHYDSRGRVDVNLLKQLLPFDDYEFYLVGPVPFMRSLFAGLCAMGVAEDRIHYEFFGPASTLTESARPKALDAGDGQKGDGAVEVRFASSGVQANWHKDSGSLLDLAEQNGLKPAYSCRSGICGTCMCALVEGEVEYTEEPLNPPAGGTVLICVARPTTPVVLDL